MGAVEISSAFDAGNIEVVDASDASKPITLKVPDDPYTELEKKNHKQVFTHGESLIHDIMRLLPPKPSGSRLLECIG